ncbi:MAG TPA: nucleotidyltransferase domain-containing protein [Vicinamibacterales bacterium]
MAVDTGLICAVIARELARERGVISAYLFGSVAEARASRESDVDIGVLLDRRSYPAAADRFDVRLRLTAALRAPLGGEPDVVILNDAPPQLARRIVGSTPVVVYDPETDHAFRRLTLSRAADLEPFLQRTRRVKLRSLAR